MKTCTKCKEEKPLGDFYKNKSFKDGLSFYCKTCHNKQVRRYEKNNPEKLRKHNIKKCKKWKSKNVDYIKKNSAEKYAKNKQDILNSDRYICRVLFKRSGLEGIIPNSIIEAKKINLKIFRSLKNEKY